MTPDVTVIMATWNRGRHILPSVRSVLGQTHGNFELLVIGDEVTGDLDGESGLAIMRLLAKLNEEGMTIVFVTHDPRMAEFARRLIHIYDGKLSNGDPGESLPS